ncbi:MAG: putative capsid protein [Hanko toti-like virus 2]|nr:MAG: putative capsid protein [Hanko toti-like virus 2]
MCEILEDDREYERIENPRPPRQQRRGTPREDGQSGDDDEQRRKKAPKPPTPPQPNVTPEEKRKQLRAVITRIVNKIRNGGSICFLHWLVAHKPRQEFVRAVVDKLLGSEWTNAREWTEVHLLADQYLFASHTQEVYLLKLLTYYRRYPDVALACPNTEAELAKSKLHNKVMHAYNGNIDTPNETMGAQRIDTMVDVEQTPLVVPLMMAQPKTDNCILRNHDFATHLGQIWGLHNQHFNEYFESDRLQFKAQGRDNVVDPTVRDVTFPCSPLLPREFAFMPGSGHLWVYSAQDVTERKKLNAKLTAHNDALHAKEDKEAWNQMTAEDKKKIEDALISAYGDLHVELFAEVKAGEPKRAVHGGAATTRLKVWEVQPMTAQGMRIVPSVRAGLLEEQKQKDVGLTLRKGSVSMDGFANADMLAVENEPSLAGLCMEQFCLRAVLLLEWLSWDMGWECNPQCMLSLFDPWVLAIKQNVERTFNESPVFGEACGGRVAPEFPFGGGTGSLRIHLNLTTVRDNFRAGALFVPNTILEATANPSKTLAVLLMLHCEWPACMLGYDIFSRPNPDQGVAAGAGYANHHVSAASLVHVPGEREVNMIFPSYLSDASGRNQPSTTPRWFFTSGPTATGNLPANTQLNYCGRAGAHDQVVYNLTDFIASWVLDISTDDVMRVLNKINVVMPLEETMAAMRDVANVACYLYPKLTLGKNNEYPTPCRSKDHQFSTHVLMDYTSGSGLSPHWTTKDFPLRETFSSDFIVNAFENMAWNQVILGLAHVDRANYANVPPIRPEYTNKGVFMNNVARSVLFASTWHLMLQWQGATCQTWLTHRVNMNSNWIPSVLPLCYGSVSGTTEDSLAPAGFNYPIIMKALFGLRPTTITWHFIDGSSRPMTVFDRTCFTGELATVYDTNGVEYKGYIPTVITDAWMHLTAYWLPRGWVPFPPPAKVGAPRSIFTMQGITGQYLRFQQIGINYVSSFYVGPMVEYFPPIVIGRELDEERWNKRLYVSSGQRFRIVNVVGANIGDVDQTGKLPWMRINNLREGCGYPPEHLGQSTLCISNYDDQARRTFVLLEKRYGGLINGSSMGSSYVDRAVWLRDGVVISELVPGEIVVNDPWMKHVLNVVQGFRSVSVAEEARPSPAPTAPPAAEQATLPESTPQ